MSFIINDSSIVKQNAAGSLFTSTNVKADNYSSIEIFNQSLPESEEKSDKAVDTVEKEEVINRNFDIDELVKKYKKDPSKILDELGINFTPEQKKELESLIKDKKSLKSFLEIAKQDKLKASDIFEGMKKTVEKKSSGVFKKIKNVFKTLINEGFSEAVDLAKSEKVYYAGKLGSNMNEIREDRDDFSSKGVANVAQAVTDEPEIKDSTMHFVQKNETAGKKLYTETDVTKAVGIMQENPKAADKFCANAVELEAIKDTKNNIKYKGSTIINVSDRMTQKSELKGTMMAVAKKSDMTDEYLDNTTDNLYKNPDMEESVRFTTTAKNKDGSDKFSACQINTTSNHLVDKNKEYCCSYASNVKEFSQYENVNSEKILSATQQATQNPESKSQVISELSGNVKNSQVSGNTQENSDSHQKTSNSASNAQSASSNTERKTVPYSWRGTSENNNKLLHTVSIDGQDYPRSSVLEVLKRKYGSSVAEMMLSKMENNPKFIEYVKQYGGQKDIIEALIKDESKVQKLKSASASIDNTKLAEMLKLATNETNTNNLIAFTEKYGATTAIKMTRESKFNNTEEETANILSKSTLDASAKKAKIEELLSGSGKKQAEG